jgi:hypothetical protein
MSGLRWLVLAPLPLIAFLAVPSPSAAQIAFDTPRLISPRGPGGLGVHWLRAETLPGDADAVLVTWAPSALPDGVRLRGGGGTGAGDDPAGFGGFDVQAPLLRGGEQLPLDLDWYTGLGAGVGNHVLLTLPLGLSAAISWSSGSVWLSPYVSAGLAADLRLGEFEGAEEFEVLPAADVGLDLALDAARRFVLRAAASIGDRQSTAIGLVVGGGARTR